ncbi:hypothetical protein Lesp02_36110 [Lentzea sp. NBRC 105346]|uniref:DUF6328 family protein n=1 Tax=Lentzea sp. NBRC 105346 TaxID=3032205 RepID=UPI0024A131AA|nr:DUF6328 family protein [Lentzea sp. NBRC 105346]GLZ31423.1 hypothetical protein Lesp02_36110 [Lentzea sp. NBRC 105346]
MSDAEESDQKRLARNVNELLQELRVAQAGVQILFGFLLSIAFTDKYASVGGLVRGVHLTTVLCAAMAVALLTAPAAWHRVLFRQGRREDIVSAGNTFALVGLGFLAVAMTGTVFVLAEVIVGGWSAFVIGLGALMVFGTLWFVLPVATRDSDGNGQVVGRVRPLGDDITDV